MPSFTSVLRPVASTRRSFWISSIVPMMSESSAAMARQSADSAPKAKGVMCEAALRLTFEYSSEPSKDWAVSRVVKRGFSRADKVLRAEEVVVTRFRNKPSEPDRGGDQ